MSWRQLLWLFFFPLKAYLDSNLCIKMSEHVKRHRISNLILAVVEFLIHTWHFLAYSSETQLPLTSLTKSFMLGLGCLLALCFWTGPRWHGVWLWTCSCYVSGPPWLWWSRNGWLMWGLAGIVAWGWDVVMSGHLVFSGQWICGPLWWSPCRTGAGWSETL